MESATSVYIRGPVGLRRARGQLRWQRLVVLIFLVAFGLRMVYVQGRPLWYDEAFAILYACLSPAQMIYGTVTPVEGAGAADVHPLLYYFLLHGWMGLAGRSPLAARFLSVALGMIAVALILRLGVWCFGWRTGLAAGLLAAVNPFHVVYSQEARMYALLGLGAVVAVWGLLRGLEEARDEKQKVEGRKRDAGGRRLVAKGVAWWRWWAVYAGGAALTLYAHNLGVFFLLALHLLAVARRRWWARLSSLALADLVALVLFSPWLIGVLPGQVGFVERGYWLTPPGMEEVVRAFLLPVLTFYEPAPLWVLGLGLFTCLLLLTLLVLRIWQVRSRAGWFLLLCWVPVASLLLVSQWRPLYLERALLPSALLYLVAVGWLLVRGGLPRPLRLGLAVLLTVSVAGSLGVHYTYARFPRPPFLDAVAYLEPRVGPADVVVHTNKLTYFPMHVYAPKLGDVFLADSPGSPQDTLAYPTQEALGIFATPTMAEAVGVSRRVWVIYFLREVDEMQAIGINPPALSWLEDRFVEVERVEFNDLAVALYCREGS